MKGIRKYAVLGAACITLTASSLAPVAAQSYRLSREEFRSQVASPGFSLTAQQTQQAQPPAQTGLGSMLLRSMLNTVVNKVVAGQPILPRLPLRTAVPSYNSYASDTYAPSTAHASPPPAYTPPSSSRFPATVTNILNKHELAVLGSRDVVIMVDKSGSMEEQDCPGGVFGAGLISRWQWVQSQILSMSQQAAQVLRSGITLVMFDSKAYVFHNVTPNQIPGIFAGAQPKGGTYLAKALKEQLNDYFDRRASSGGRVRPLAIAIITDGVPDSASSVRAVIADATRKMNSPGEITISFLQVGNDSQGASYLADWDNSLVQEGASYDIVDTKPFGALASIGLGRSVVTAINKVGGG